MEIGPARHQFGPVGRPPGRPTGEGGNRCRYAGDSVYDKKDVNYLGLIQLAYGLYWYRRLHRMGARDSSQNAA